jgi:hypothetical protein
VVIPMIPAWQKRRSTFNHDWLKNRFIPALVKFRNLLDDRIEDIEFEQSFVATVLPEWESHRQEAYALANDFEPEMSPRRLFDLPPLSQCDEQTRQWLGNLVHFLWLTRYPVRRWVDDTLTSAREADVAYHQIQEALEDCADVQSASALRPYRMVFVEFQKRCHELALSIQKFPSEVQAI